ncbi:alpha/beta-hydrolase [Moesziomyces antarcticus]|uniref:Related to carboxylesterase/lipase EstA n=2 Tax=Pseudozyma antarctica TaxID=84753 RepID=A0A5C3FSS8_PSEA2|nr:alpha/beta-hydrolase [Moesziomyces antarcticus]GAK66439.1 alpha/beta-hydrolase [Moesziomyces antarcticus]SPO47478.1 related to carboxylesterase/lipase EstA precursor [Moesziomyces antarcticus]
MVRSFTRLAPVLAALCLGTSRLSSALPSPAASDDIASLLLARQSADNTSASGINTNNTADCTNCTNLGNFANPIPVSSLDPVVQVRNGSYAGITIAPIAAEATLSGFGTNGTQEAFLGIPYAQQPVDELRFQRPRSLNQSWQDVRSAKRYSELCFGVGTDDDYQPPYVTYKLGERCLTLNVVRPARQDEASKLPVFVWIHGGGFSYGGSGDRRYNGSFIVDKSVELGQPLMYVSLNYRVQTLGFPVGDEASQAGVQNLGLYDQRLALHWIRENIEAFGGDKDKVTIVGESAGGASMYFHLAAYGGRDDKLFRSVIAESAYYATGLDTANNTASRNDQWTSLAQYAGCGSNSTLECLRSVPLETIKQWSINNTELSIFNPVVDGDLVAKDLQQSFLVGDFVKTVPVVLNNNLDEGISFGVRGVNNTADIVSALEESQALPDGWSTQDALRSLAQIYPDNEDVYPPFQAGAGLLPATGGVLGKNDRRSCAIFGDLRFVGPRRQATELLARSSQAAIYSSRFDQVSYKSPITAGAQHFQEVAYVFRNPLDTQNALGPLRKDIALANEISAYWISFVASGDPNTARDQGKLSDGALYWPKYDADGERSQVAWVHDGLGHRSFVTPDTYRQQGMQLLMALRSGTFKPSDFHSSHTKRDEL